MTDSASVLLLQAPVPGPHNRVVAKASAIPPLGLGYLASALIPSGFDVRICDMDVEDVGPEVLVGMLENARPSLVGISTTTLTLKNALRVARVVKYVLPGCVVCVGGPHATVCPDDVLRYPFVDVAVLGEGEYVLSALAHRIADGGRAPFRVRGTVEREDGRVGKGEARERILELDELAFPARHLMPLEAYNIPGTIVTSRGCPFACGFCAGPTVLGRRYVGRSAANVVKEVQLCVDLFGITSFYFVDDTLTHDIQRLHDICIGLRSVAVPTQLNRSLKWTCESRADVVSPELLREMRLAGCTTVQFGMESGSQRLLDMLGKRVTLQQIEDAVIWSREAGISPVLSMVVPHPEETQETLRETFGFVRRLYDAGAEKIVPALLTLFPGTRFHRDRARLGIEPLTDDTDEYNLGTPVITTRHLDLGTIANAYSQLLALTQSRGVPAIGRLGVDALPAANRP